MVLLRKPDETLNALYAALRQDLRAEVNDFQALVFSNMPDRLDDVSARSSFSKFVPVYQADIQNCQVTYRTGVARLKRLYQTIQAQSGDEQAARILYCFAVENFGRCINGLGGRLTDLEKQYVYKVGADADGLTIAAAMSLSSAFMNHRMQCLREMVDKLFPAGELRTYGWFRTHRSLLVSMNLPGTYLDQSRGDGFQGYYELATPVSFVEKYIRGGNVVSSQRSHALAEFNYNAMLNIVRENIQKGVDGSFSDEVVDYFIQSDGVLRGAYQKLQDDEVENEYFSYDATRRSFKDKAIGRILHRYGWSWERQQDGSWA